MRYGEGDGWREERTGLDKTSFIETRRHWFTGKVPHNTNGNFNVLNLIEGRERLSKVQRIHLSLLLFIMPKHFIVPAASG